MVLQWLYAQGMNGVVVNGRQERWRENEWTFERENYILFGCRIRMHSTAECINLTCIGYYVKQSCISQRSVTPTPSSLWSWAAQNVCSTNWLILWQRTSLTHKRTLVAWSPPALSMPFASRSASTIKRMRSLPMCYALGTLIQCTRQRPDVDLIMWCDHEIMAIGVTLILISLSIAIFSFICITMI